MSERQLTVGQHLQELRRRLIIATVATVATTVVAFVFYKPLVRALLRPADFGVAGGEGAQLVFIDVTEMLGVTIKVSLTAGLILASPIILYQVVMFVAPGLSSREKRFLFVSLPVSLLAFAAGVAFAYFVLIPPAMNFLLDLGSDLATPTIRIGTYINVVVRLLFWMGVVFETPLVMLILAKLGIVTSKGFARWRRPWIVLAFVLSALITPTIDPVNQCMVAIPLIVLYEVGIWLTKLAARPGRETYPGVAALGSRLREG